MLGLAHVKWFVRLNNRVHVAARDVAAVLADEAARLASLLQPQDVSNVIWAMGALNVSSQPALEVLLTRLEQILPQVRRAQVRAGIFLRNIPKTCREQRVCLQNSVEYVRDAEIL